MSENNNIQEQSGYEIETNSLISSTAFFTSTNHSTDGISMDILQNYIRYPMIYNEILREISKQSYSLNGMYAQSINTRISIPLLSYVLSQRKKDRIKKDKKKKENIALMMKLLNHEKTTRDILRKLDIYGIYVGILRDTKASNKNIQPMNGNVDYLDHIEGLSLNDNFMIQPLDLDYCKIVGMQNNIAISAFDLFYFDQFKHGGLINEIKNFPKEFLVAYTAYKKDCSKRWFILDYKTTIALTARSDSDEAYGRPYGLSAFCDMKSQQDYSNSQYKLINELASSIYYLVLPQGEKAGSCALNKDQQDNVRDAFKGAVKLNTSGNSAKISTLTLPPNTKIDKLAKDSSLLKDTLSDELIKKISTNLAFASSALNASSEGSSGFAGLQVNLDIMSSQVFQMVNQISVEYTRVLNEHAGIKPSEYIDIKYLPISYINKNDMYDKMKELYMVAGGSRTYMIAASGINPEDYLSICDDERNDNLDSLYQPHITSYTASDNADNTNSDDNLGAKSGRPESDNKDLSFSGNITKAKGDNQKVKPSTIKK